MKLLEERKSEILNLIRQLYQKDKNNYYITFLKQPRFGFNPRPTDPFTPLGIYGYRLADIFDHYLKDKYAIPFSERPFIAISKRKPEANVLLVSKITDKDVSRLKEIFAREYKHDSELHQMYANFSPNRKFFAFLQSASREVWGRESGVGPALINNKILRLMGYDIVVDDCTATIYHAEPCQVIILDPSKVELIGIFENPLLFKNVPVKDLLAGKKDIRFVVLPLLLTKRPNIEKIAEYSGYDISFVEELNNLIQKEKAKYNNIFLFMDKRGGALMKYLQNKGINVLYEDIIFPLFGHFFKRNPKLATKMLTSFKNQSYLFRKSIEKFLHEKNAYKTEFSIEDYYKIIKNHENDNQKLVILRSPMKYVRMLLEKGNFPRKEKLVFEKIIKRLVENIFSKNSMATPARFKNIFEFFLYTLPVIIKMVRKGESIDVHRELEAVSRFVDFGVLKDFVETVNQIAKRINS